MVNSSSFCVMSRAPSLWSHFPPFPLPQHVPSLLFPSHSIVEPCDPRTEGRSCQLAERSSHDMSWADSKYCKCCHRLHDCREWTAGRHKMPDVVRPCETKAKSSKKDWKWHGELVSYPTFGKDWKSCKSWKQRWNSDTSRGWCRRVEGFREHIAIDDSLERVSTFF